MTTASISPIQHIPHPSSSLRASDAVFSVLDLTSGGRDPMGTVASLSTEERESFLNVLAKLLQRGVIGMETLEVDGRPRKTFVAARMADPELAHARPYRSGRLLNRRA